MKQSILELSCHKHIKIYKLKQLGLTDKEIAEAIGTNVGHVYNELKKYKDNQERQSKADAVVVNAE